MTTEQSKIEFTFGFELDGDGKQIKIEDRNYAIASILRAAAGMWGGYTLTEARGGWVNPRGVLVQEQSAVLSVVVSKDLVDGARVATMVKTIKQYLAQEAVAVTITPVNFSIR